MSAEEDMTPLYRLFLLGFLAHTPQGAGGSRVVMCIRQRMDLYDTVRVHSPERAQAVRSVNGVVTKEASGSFAEVVADVEDWPMILTVTGEGLA